MKPCVICIVPTTAAPMKYLFTPMDCCYMKNFFRCDMENLPLCYQCYIKFGTIINLIEQYRSRKLQNEKQMNKLGLNRYRCYFCIERNNIRLFHAADLEYMHFIQTKLLDGKMKSKSFLICPECEDIICKLNRLLIIYHESKLSPLFDDCDVNDSGTVCKAPEPEPAKND